MHRNMEQTFFNITQSLQFLLFLVSISLSFKNTNTTQNIFSLFFSVDPLFSNDKQKIDVEWMRKVFSDKDEEKLKTWTMKLTDQEVVNVGDLKELSEEKLERCGIPIAIASELSDRCHPKT